MRKLDPARIIRRLDYYARNLTADLMPHIYFAHRLEVLRRDLECMSADSDVVSRVGYYNKLAVGERCRIDSERPPTVWDGSRYYYDFMETRRYFDPSLRCRVLFGDITHVPDQPTFLKSRPIEGDNRNSVLLKLDRLRHFQIYKDPYTFEEKLPLAVWRGNIQALPWRQRLVERHYSSPRCDIGPAPVAYDRFAAKPYLSPVDQMAFRYILSIEGQDVATNLKWVMASNSLCMMPRPRFETWFMEGRLTAGTHYVELRADYEDLEEKIDYYEKHADEALAIISNANAHVRQFSDKRREKLIQLLVMSKYFDLVGSGYNLEQNSR